MRIDASVVRRVAATAITVFGGLVAAAFADQPSVPRLGLVVDESEAAARPKADGTVVLLSSDFETVWPVTPWRVTHADGAPAVDWGRTTFRAAVGSHSIWCAAGGAAAPGAGQPVPPGTFSWAIVGPYDLSEATAGRLSFDLWLRTEQLHDVFMWLASTDGVTFSGTATSTDTPGWRGAGGDLQRFGGAGDVTGQPRVWFALAYRADYNHAFEGAYVDHLTLTADFGSPAVEGITYTTKADFEQGTLVGLDAGGDALALADGWSGLPFVWVPHTADGMVSRLDVSDGSELGRYRTGPDRTLEASAVAVDLDGACWVGNRAAGSVVKIGLEEQGDCVDRDGDGTIETSRDANSDGEISGAELLAWGADECVLYELTTAGGTVASHVPGSEHGDYADNGLAALAVTAANDLWIAVPDDRRLYRIATATGSLQQTLDLAAAELDPRALVADPAGPLWTADPTLAEVLRVNPDSDADDAFALDHLAYALGLDDAGHLYVGAGDGGEVSQLDRDTGEVQWTRDVGIDARAVVTTADGDAWVAVPGARVVQRVSGDGFIDASIQLTGQATALAVDSAGKVWTMGADSVAIQRLNPATNRADLVAELPDVGGHDAIGDLTGVVARSVVTRRGSWQVVYDSGSAATPWGTIGWVATVPSGSEIVVRVRSSEDEALWSAWETARDDVALSATPAGRYLQVGVILQLSSGSDLPVLDELTVTPAAVVEAPVAGFTWSPASPVAGDAVQFTDTTTNAPTSWAWDFGDGATSGQQNPGHSFAEAGTYTVSLTATNAGGSDTDSAQVTVRSAGSCSLECAATVPAAAVAGQAAQLEATATATSCQGAVAYSWDFGDGGTGAGATVEHTYLASGAYDWRLTASVDGLVCSRQGTLAVGDDLPVCSRPRWIPVASHVSGVGASAWRTDLGVLGVAGDGGVLDVRLLAADQVSVKRYEIAPGRMLDLTDVVQLLRPGADLSAPILVCTDDEVALTSRTYNRLAADDPCLPNGSFGQRLDGLTAADGLAAGQVAVLPQLRETAAFRTNLGFTNAGVVAAVLRVTLRDGSGAAVTTYTVGLEPGEWRQDSSPFVRRAGLSSVPAGSARVEVVSGAGLLVYASLIDNVTNDAATVLPQRIE